MHFRAINRVHKGVYNNFWISESSLKTLSFKKYLNGWRTSKKCNYKRNASETLERRANYTTDWNKTITKMAKNEGTKYCNEMRSESLVELSKYKFLNRIIQLMNVTLEIMCL